MYPVFYLPKGDYKPAYPEQGWAQSAGTWVAVKECKFRYPNKKNLVLTMYGN